MDSKRIYSNNNNYIQSLQSRVHKGMAIKEGRQREALTTGGARKTLCLPRNENRSSCDFKIRLEKFTLEKKTGK